MKIKICGITRPEDAVAAADLGATHIGLNFWPGSRRYVTPDQAALVLAAIPSKISTVAVFVNAEISTITKFRQILNFDLVQFHGDEKSESCEIFAGSYIRALRVTGAVDTSPYPGAVAFLLDTPTEGYGGSGRAFDHTLARCDRPFFLAGGLDPDNVAAAVRAVRPYGVDVASGVESSPGIKDHDKLRRFIRAAKEASS